MGTPVCKTCMFTQDLPLVLSKILENRGAPTLHGVFLKQMLS